MSPWLLLIVGWCVAGLMMSIVWWAQLRIGNAGIVDVAWTFVVGILGAAFAILSHGLVERRAIVATLALVWSIRLGVHLWHRVATSPEDGRYRDLKEKWGSDAPRRMFAFFQIQAIGALVFAAPMLLAGQNTRPLQVWDFLAIVVWIVSVVGEGIADWQLKSFAGDPANKGKVCQRGLWRYSRHPNYFFEWLHWWAYVLLAIGSPWGWLAITAPLAMLYLLLYVTGIPPTEAQSLRSRGEAYRRYQQTTSAFFPWPPQPASGVKASENHA